MVEAIEAVRAVVEAYGKVEAIKVEVAVKYFAIKGSVELTTLKAFRVLPDQDK